MIGIALRCTFFVVIILLKWISAKKLLKMGTKQKARSDLPLIASSNQCYNAVIRRHKGESVPEFLAVGKTFRALI